ncbi:MAG: hypothetical protein M1829_002567, partial [Trizodia sp. TS-e1964]
LQSAIHQLAAAPQDPSPILARLTRLSTSTTDNKAALPPYDQRACAQQQQTLQALTDQVAAARAALAPPPRFSFKKTARAPEPARVADVVPPPTSAAPQPASSSSSSNGSAAITISDLTNAHVVLPAPPTSTEAATAAATTTTVSLRAIRASVVDLSRAPCLAALQVLDTTDSLVVCARRIAGAAHVTGAQRCTLVLACGQLRLHACVDVDVYVLCGSRPVVEECRGVGVAPFPAAWVSVFPGALPMRGLMCAVRCR